MTDGLQSSSTLFNSVLLFFHNCQRYPKREADAQEGVLNGQFELTPSQYCKFSKRVRTIALDTRLWFWRRHCHSPMPNRRLARHSKGAERIPTHQASLAPMAFSAPTAESTWEWSQTARNTEIHSTMLAKELATCCLTLAIFPLAYHCWLHHWEELMTDIESPWPIHQSGSL